MTNEMVIGQLKLCEERKEDGARRKVGKKGKEDWREDTRRKQ